MKYPNKYYEELANKVIENTSLKTNKGEVVFYEGQAFSQKKIVKETKTKPKKKLSFFITPILSGISRKTESQTITTTTNNTYSGTLYITNMRLVFTCEYGAFDLIRETSVSVSKYADGILVKHKSKKYPIYTNDSDEILYILQLIHKAMNNN